MILIKFGGSVITDKSKPLSASRQKIAAMSRAVSRMGEPAIVVHGGGSFGHYWSVRYDMHTKKHSYDTKGVATVKNSMVQLNQIILDEMLGAGLRPYAVAPAGFMARSSPVRSRVKELGQIAVSSDMTPVTYGDAIWYGRKGPSDENACATYILSGDRIMTHLAGILRPRLCMFAMEEDGLYNDMKSKRLVRVVRAQGSHAGGWDTDRGADDAAHGSQARPDVTGGMTRKIEEAARITGMGIPVALVNGNHPRRMQDAAKKGGRFKGTLFEPGMGRGGRMEKREITSAG